MAPKTKILINRAPINNNLKEFGDVVRSLENSATVIRGHCAIGDSSLIYAESEVEEINLILREFGFRVNFRLSKHYQIFYDLLYETYNPSKFYEQIKASTKKCGAKSS